MIINNIYVWRESKHGFYTHDRVPAMIMKNKNVEFITNGDILSNKCNFLNHNDKFYEIYCGMKHCSETIYKTDDIIYDVVVFELKYNPETNRMETILG